MPEWLTSCAAPLLYYEQGHEWLFGDPVRFREGTAAAAQVGGVRLKRVLLLTRNVVDRGPVWLAAL